RRNMARRHHQVTGGSDVDSHDNNVGNRSGDGNCRRRSHISPFLRNLLFFTYFVATIAFPASAFWATVFTGWELTWPWVSVYFGIVITTLTVAGIIHPDEALTLV